MAYPYKVGQNFKGTEVTAGDVWDGFTESTTIHGISQMNGTTGSRKKLLWFLVCLVALGLLTLHLVTICKLYFSYGKNVQITILRENEMDFPAVTFCNLNPIKKSTLGLDKVLESILTDETPTKRKRRKRSAEGSGIDKVSKSIPTDNKPMIHKRMKRGSKGPGNPSSPVCLTTDPINPATGLCYHLLKDEKRKLMGVNSADSACSNLGSSVYMPTMNSTVQFMISTDLFNWMGNSKVKVVSRPNIFNGTGIDRYWNWMFVDKWANEYEIVQTSAYTNWQPAFYDPGLPSSHSVVSDGHSWYSADERHSEYKTYTICQSMVECPHEVYDPDMDGIGFCWFMPIAETMNEWEQSNYFCPLYAPNSRLIELDSADKANYFINSSGVLDNVIQKQYWLGINNGKWVSDGRPVLWSNFAPNPFTYFDDEAVRAYINEDHQWKYADDSDMFLAEAMIICEIDLPVRKISTTESATTTTAPTTIEQTTTTILPPTTTTGSTTTTALPDTITPVPTTTTITTTTEQTTVSTTETFEKTTNISEQDPTSVESSTTLIAEPITNGTTTKAPSSIEGKPVLREEFLLLESVIENLAIIPESTKSLMGYNNYEFIVDCTYEGSECSKDKMTVFYSPVMGNCFIFNSGWNSSQRTYKASKAGRLYGLSVILNIGEDEYIEKLGGSSGVRILPVNQNEMPHPEEEGILAEPGKLTSIGLRKVAIKRLPIPYGNCTENYKNLEADVYVEKYPVNYSQKNCLKTCYQKMLIKQCQCADSHYPMYGAALGGISTHPCDVNNIIEDDCRYKVNQQYIRGELKCSYQCPDACSESYHSFDLSMSKWPSAAHRARLIEKLQPTIGNLNLSSSDVIDRNLLTVEVFYEDFSYEEIREVQAYDVVQFASDIGGILGLWVGMSVITAIEIIELCMDLIMLRLSKVCSKSTKKRRDFCRVSSTSDFNTEQRNDNYNNKKGLIAVKECFPPSNFKGHENQSWFQSRNTTSPSASTQTPILKVTETSCKKKFINNRRIQTRKKTVISMKYVNEERQLNEFI